MGVGRRCWLLMGACALTLTTAGIAGAVGDTTGPTGPPDTTAPEPPPATGTVATTTGPTITTTVEPATTAAEPVATTDLSSATTEASPSTELPPPTDGDCSAIVAGDGDTTAVPPDECITDGPKVLRAPALLEVAPLAVVDVTDSGAITIPGPSAADQIGAAAPYPSTITVAGQTGLVTDVDVQLSNVSHSAASDLDLLLVGPGGQNLIVLSDVGAPATLVTFSNANITLDDSGGSPASSGTVTGNVSWRPFNNAPVDAFPTPAPTPSTNTSLATTFAGTNPNGTWSLYVYDDATGDVGSIGSWSLTITTEEAADATTTTVTSAANPTLVGGSVTFTATVLSGATPVTSGSVMFTDGPTTLAGSVALNASGQATFTTSALGEGSHLIRATYSGAVGFLTSSGTVAQVVDTPTTTPAAGQWCNTGPIAGPGSALSFAGPASPYPSRITVSGAGAATTLVTVQLGSVSHAVPVDFDVLLVSPTGQSVVLMSDVGGIAAASGATLTFADTAAGTIPEAGPLTAGTYRPSDADSGGQVDSFPAPAPAPSAATTLATFNTFNPNGVWRLFVADDAGADGGAVSGGWCLNIRTAAATATSLTSSLNPSTVGDSVTFTATVTSGGSPVTSGTVSFADGATPLGSSVALDASGQATLTTSGLMVGTHAISAEYGGTADFQQSAAAVTQVVTRASSATALTSSVNPSTLGQSVTFTANVTYASGQSLSAPVADGSVTFTDASIGLLGTVALSAGSASVTTAALAVGTHTVTASYSGATGTDASNNSIVQVVDGVADAGGQYAINEGGSLALDGTASLAGPGAVYSWDVDGDGTFGDATGVAPTLTWGDLESMGFDGDDPPSHHPITLQLTDGATFTAVTDLTIANVAPTVTSLTNDGPVGEGSTATVTVNGASDPSSIDLAALVYRFDFGNDGTVDVEGPSPSVVVPASLLGNGPATFDVSAVVTDPDGGQSASLTTTITVTNTAPTAYIEGPTSAVAGQPVTVKVGALDPSPDDMTGTFEFTVDWGDGSPPITVSGPADPPVSHTYTTPGSYTVVATATDPDRGVSAPVEFVVTVVAAPTTSTNPPTTTPAGSSTTVVGALPDTGTGVGNFVLVAIALLGAGFGTFFVGRRLRHGATRG